MSSRKVKPVSSSERTKAVRSLARDGQYKAVKAAHFCDIERDLPIAGTPVPKPCPFCGLVDVAIVFERNETNGTQSAHVQCDNCGIDGPFTGDGMPSCDTSYGLALRAAELWNTRKGGAS